MARVLVTGGAGFLGSRIVRQLVERGDEVVSLDTREPAPDAAWWLAPVIEKVCFATGSIDNWGDVVGVMRTYEPERIVHTAAITSPVALFHNPHAALNVNITGGFNMLEAARLFGIQRFVNFSTVAVLTGVQYEPIDANHPVMVASEGPGASFYAASKVSVEALCWAYHQSYGLDFVTIRPSAVYGFGMRYPIFVKPIVENAVNGIPTHFGQGYEFPRDYTHVDDVAQLAVLAVHAQPGTFRDRVYFGATGEPLVTAGMVAEIVRELIPGAAISIGPGLSEEDQIEIRYRGVLSVENAREQLGYAPRFTRIRDGLEDYIATYRRFRVETGAG
jgi:nucleoside-diphosphate-sugar epimerase